MHTITQNSFLMQNKIFISFPTKIKNTFTENEKFLSDVLRVLENPQRMLNCVQESGVLSEIWRVSTE